jgi:predicted flap endonuclease-1-like 5' DNA nuclease
VSRLGIIEGINEINESRLKEAGVFSLEDLLQQCISRKGRNDLAEKTGITEKVILKWANQVDLARIKGIGGEYAELLEAAGVNTVPELAKRNPDNLRVKMVEINNAKKMVKKLPARRQVEDWIRQAVKLPRTLQY